MSGATQFSRVPDAEGNLSQQALVVGDKSGYAYPMQAVGTQAPSPYTAATIPYSDFTAGATYYAFLGSVLKLTKPAQRSVSFVNSMDQNVTSINGVGIYDSTVLDGTQQSLALFDEAKPSVLINSSGSTTLGSPANLALINFGDSLFASLAMGSTAPTQGNVTILVKEV